MLQRMNDIQDVAKRHRRGEITWDEAMDEIAAVERAHKRRELGLDNKEEGEVYES